MNFDILICCLACYLVGLGVGAFIVWKSKNRQMAHLIELAKSVGVEIEVTKNGCGITVKNLSRRNYENIIQV